MSDKINTSKVTLTEEQKRYIKEQVDATKKASIINKVRIPPEIEEVSLRWVKYSPFLSEFLLRFNYFMTESIPTMGVNSKMGRINLYINPKFLRGGQLLPKMEWRDKNDNLLREDKNGKLYDSNNNIVNKDDAQYVPVFKKNKKGEIEFDPFGKPLVEEYESDPLTEEELEGVLFHEVEHLIRAHGERALEDKYIWNIAADMLINEDLLTISIGKRQLVLPKGAVYLNQAIAEGYKGEKVTEELYFWLMDKRNEYRNKMQDLIDQNGQQTGQGNCQVNGQQPGQGDEQNHSQGTTMGDELFDAIYGSKIDDHSVMEESDALADQVIKEIIDTAKIRGWGNTHGTAISTIDELCKGPKINWKTLLRKMLSAYVNSPGNIYENNWSKRNRRGLPLPGTKKLSNKIIIGIDTSGSISEHEIQVFFSEVEKIVKNVGNLVVCQWDTKVASVWKDYKRGDYKKIKVKGRGGTDVQDMFDWMIENKMKSYPLVMFTDGWFDYSFNHNGVKTIWCVTDEAAYKKIPHGRNIHVEINKYH